MDYCFNCGDKTDPDWVFCRSCGSALEDNETDDLAIPASGTTAPTVELISRGWDEIVDTIEAPADPLEGNEISPGPLPPDTIEVTVEDITVVEADVAEEPVEEPVEDPVEESVEEPANETGTTEEQETELEKPTDQWDHLRPHGELPPLQRQVTVPGRVGQALALLTALAALVAAGLHFFLNTRLDAFSNGELSARAVDDVELIADMSLVVVAGLAVISALGLGFWLIRSRPEADLRPGKAGIVALVSFLAGVAVVTTSFIIKKETVTEAIAANSLIVLGLGLLMTACLATVRTVDRIDRKEPA